MQFVISPYSVHCVLEMYTSNTPDSANYPFKHWIVVVLYITVSFLNDIKTKTIFVTVIIVSFIISYDAGWISLGGSLTAFFLT